MSHSTQSITVSAYLGEFVDEGEFAGYVDSGIWEIELFLADVAAGQVRRLRTLMQHLWMLDSDD